MMKLTVAFLASLAAVDAAHGRRHIRRADYGYSEYPAYPLPSSSSAAPLGTGSPSSSGVETPISSSVEAEETFPTFTETGPIPTFPGTGTGTGVVPSSTALPEGGESTSVIVDETPYPTGTGVVPTGTGVVPSGTGYPENPETTEYVTSVITSTQIYTVTVETGISLSTTTTHITTVCTKETGVPSSVYLISSGTSVIVKEEPTGVITDVVTSTYTYNIGTGTSAHAVTTEIVSTITRTLYETIHVTLGPSGGVPQTTGSPEENEATVPTGTTTVSSTSTTTKYITVYPTTGVPEAEGTGVPAGPSGGEECAPPVTVTITAQETVTVTAGQEEAPSTTAAGEEVTTSDILPTGTLVATVPYPLSNSTVIPGSTGFVTSTKVIPGGDVSYPPYPTGTGVLPPPPSGTADLPSFTFENPEGVPTELATPSTTAAAVEPTTSSASPTEGYGYYRKRFGLF